MDFRTKLSTSRISTISQTLYGRDKAEAIAAANNMTEEDGWTYKAEAHASCDDWLGMPVTFYVINIYDENNEYVGSL